MKWITRKNVKVDRVAGPWLIKKFVDPDAEFVFLPQETIGPLFKMGPFTMSLAAKLGHHGEEVSFDAILKKYRLADPALSLLAAIVRAADSHPSNPNPAGEGLRWIAHGFSALRLTDHEILDREFILYDALFAECLKRVAS